MPSPPQSLRDFQQNGNCEKSKNNIEFDVDRHARHFAHLAHKLPPPYQAMSVNRLTILYFCVSALDLLDRLEFLGDKKRIIDYIYSYQFADFPRQAKSEISKSTTICEAADQDLNPEENSSKGGFHGYRLFCCGDRCEQGCFFEFTHIANTYTALMCLLILGDDLGKVDRHALGRQLKAWQCADGSFTCVTSPDRSDDAFLERDIRFVYCASVICYVLDLWDYVDLPAMRKFLLSSRCLLQGFGIAPGTESHGGCTYCALAALQLSGGLHDLARPDHLLDWLVHRQSEGFNGRVNKPPDSCYSFWCGSSLGLLGAESLVDSGSLLRFLKRCEFPHGGFLKTPQTMYPDILHSYYAVCGLSIAGYLDNKLEYELGISKRAICSRVFHPPKNAGRAGPLFWGAFASSGSSPSAGA